jgi:hypothetical protein
VKAEREKMLGADWGALQMMRDLRKEEIDVPGD